jgi:serine/threonine protein kinase
VLPPTCQKRNKMQAYNQSADIWSCGVILFVLLCGFPPYEGVQGANGRPDYTKSLQKIQQRCDAEGRFDYFPDPYWSSISKSSQDLIRSMVVPAHARPLLFALVHVTSLHSRVDVDLLTLHPTSSNSLHPPLTPLHPSHPVSVLQVVLDPAKRLSADACLKHPWLSGMERRPSTDRPPTSPTFFVEALERIRGINADRFVTRRKPNVCSKNNRLQQGVQPHSAQLRCSHHSHSLARCHRSCCDWR